MEFLLVQKSRPSRTDRRRTGHPMKRDDRTKCSMFGRKAKEYLIHCQNFYSTDMGGKSVRVSAFDNPYSTADIEESAVDTEMIALHP